MVGISAMLGAGIFVLTGVALRTAGPGALLTFGLSGLLALITAFSFAELASAFPESGGSYVFAKRVFPIGGAFSAGWVLWLAYVVAAALYALGFGSFLQLALAALGISLSAWATTASAVGVLVLGFLTLRRGGASAGNAVTIGKVLAFLALIVPGLWLIAQQPLAQTAAAIGPALLPNGAAAVLTAMTFTFIALEGFEVIAAVAGEVRDPAITIPRAMFLAIAITITLYLSLLLILIVLGGSGQGLAWVELGELGERAVAVGAERYLGSIGRWIVVLGGLAATFTALSSALLAASRASCSMAQDRALPRSLARLDPGTGAPTSALAVSLGLAIVLVVSTGEVEIAGATASLIFLLSFALTNAAGLLVRVRGGVDHAAYQAPLYPAMPLLGITGCLALAAIQVVTTPIATVLGTAWLVLGLGVYRFWLRARAETMSALAEATDADLARLRGREPLVLVPVALPDRAETLVELAHDLAPPAIGRVLALCVAKHDPDDPPEHAVIAYDRTSEAMRRAVRSAARSRRAFEGIIRVAPDVEEAIAKTIRERKPEILLLGMTSLTSAKSTAFLERVVAHHPRDVAIFNPASDTLTLGDVRRILVPVAGGSGHDPLRARVLGLLDRAQRRHVTLLRIVPNEADRPEALAQLGELAEDLRISEALVEVSRDPTALLLERAAACDLILIGLSRRPGAPLFGKVVQAIARDARCSILMIARA